MRDTSQRGARASYDMQAPLARLREGVQELQAYNEQLVPLVCGEALTVSQMLLASRLTLSVTGLIAEYQALEAQVSGAEDEPWSVTDIEEISARMSRACGLADSLRPQFLNLRGAARGTLLPYLAEKSTRLH